jgi:glutamyl/glutaminyl-tRNA synthetase
MRALPRAEFTTNFVAELSASKVDTKPLGESYLDAVVAMMQGRTKLWSDVVKDSSFFFTESFGYDPKAARKRLQKEGVSELLSELQGVFSELSDFSEASVEDAVRSYAEQKEIPVANAVHALRVACSGLGHGPGLFEMLALLGRDRVSARVERALTCIATCSFPEGL